MQGEWRKAGIVQGDVAEYHVERWEKIDEAGTVSYYYVANVLFLVDRDLEKQFLVESLQSQKAKATNENAKKNIDRALELTKKMAAEDFKDW